MPAYAGGDCGRAAARITELACRLFVRSHAASITPAQALKVLECAERAKRFSLTATPGGFFSEFVSTLLWNGVFPDEPDLPLVVVSAEAAAFFLSASGGAIANRHLSAFARQALPAIALLADATANRSVFQNAGAELLECIGVDLDKGAKELLERKILDGQAKTGGWLWSVFGTSLNLLALRAFGHDAEHDAIRRGIAFIDGLRAPHAGGSRTQSWCNAEIWDTSVAGTTLLSAGIEPRDLDRVVDAVVLEQQPDGLWAFGIGALEGDNDSSALALTFLSHAAKHLAPEQRERVAKASLRCAEALLSAQQDDGGFGYSPEPYDEPYGFGRRIPFGIETALVDASTADVTGRVMGAMLAAARTFGEPAFAEHVQTRLERAVRFLEKSQGETGSWPGRWTSGYLSSLAFALPSVRVVAPELVDSGWVRRCRRFVLAHRNADGGWGETTEADSRPDLAGDGASTPVQTAYAATALVATRGPDDDDRALEGAVRHLERSAAFGQWHNDRALYTVAFREDYFDAPFMTNAMVTNALLYARAALALGADRATELLVLG